MEQTAFGNNRSFKAKPDASLDEASLKSLTFNSGLSSLNGCGVDNVFTEPSDIDRSEDTVNLETTYFYIAKYCKVLNIE